MTWLWMYMNWLQDLEDKHEFATDYSIFVGSFANPEGAKKMMESRKPTYSISEEEFDESTKKVIESRKNSQNQIKSLHRRRRRKILTE